MNERQRTINMYGAIKNEARLYIATRSAAKVPLNEFCRATGYSRRTVQRALTYLGTTWRTLNAERSEDARSA